MIFGSGFQLDPAGLPTAFSRNFELGPFIGQRSTLAEIDGGPGDVVTVLHVVNVDLPFVVQPRTISADLGYELFVEEGPVVVCVFVHRTKTGLVSRVLVEETGRRPRPTVGLDFQVSLRAVAKHFIDRQAATRRVIVLDDADSGPVRRFLSGARRIPADQFPVLPAVGPQQFSHAFHVPRRSATAKPPIHETMHAFVQQQVPPIVRRRLLKQPQLIALLKPVQERRQLFR